jgi:hypothetical protein
VFDHRDDVLAGGIVAGGVVPFCVVRDVDVVVRLSIATLAPDLVGPAADVGVADVLILAAEQVVDRGLGLGRQSVLGDPADDLVAFDAPGESRRTVNRLSATIVKLEMITVYGSIAGCRA